MTNDQERNMFSRANPTECKLSRTQNRVHHVPIYIYCPKLLPQYKSMWIAQGLNHTVIQEQEISGYPEYLINPRRMESDNHLSSFRANIGTLSRSLQEKIRTLTLSRVQQILFSAKRGLGKATSPRSVSGQNSNPRTK